MSTVLWANQLLDGQVISDEADKHALYKFSKKLDRLSKKLNVTPFIDAQDTTDAEYNFSDQELPTGMESTNELMAAEGTWIDAAAAVTMLKALIAEIEHKDIRFGLLGNAKEAVLSELGESLAFAEKAAADSAKFNFAVVL